MTVYIDDMCDVPLGEFRGRRGRTMKMSHMIADTPDELHAFAARLGMQRRWAQNEDVPAHLHYDVAKGKRAEAIKMGAVPVTLKQLACMCTLRLHGQPMGDPATAVERRLALRGKFPAQEPTR